MFGGSTAGAGATPEGRPDADNVFADAFEEVSLLVNDVPLSSQKYACSC